jgi:DNA mismatch repair protein MSH5
LGEYQTRKSTEGSTTTECSRTERIQFSFHALKIKDVFQNMLGGETIVVRAKVFEQFEGYHLAQVGRRISETVRSSHNPPPILSIDKTKVDLEKSAEESRTVMLPGIDDELDQMKRVFEGLPDLLSQVARKLCETVPSDVQGSLNVVYFPQIGFLVTVPIVPTTGVAAHSGSFDDPWECMFSTE